ADPAEFEENPQAYDIPDSVISLLNGELGDPPGGWPEPFRTKALAGRTFKPARTELSPHDDEALDQDPRPTLNRLLFPGPTRDFEEAYEEFSDVSALPTKQFLYGMRRDEEIEVAIEKGKKLLLSISAIGEPDDRGMVQVVCAINGQQRSVWVRDESVSATVAMAERADPSIPGQIPAPFAGVVTLTVGVGDQITAGQQVATIEAMKMEAAITSPVAGTVTRLAIGHAQAVEGRDLLLVIQ
ncbi:MAG: biotin/lipoyl-containing protein, partial [Propionicimonas sp.]|nr:biotin/lipoyl-containing protein [Propionicimonas sp.]